MIDTNISQALTFYRKLSTFDSRSDLELIIPSLPIKRAKPGEKVPPIKTQARSATILPNFVGLKFQIHDGKNYQDITITEDMVGHKLGEFAPYVQSLRAATPSWMSGVQ